VQSISSDLKDATIIISTSDSYPTSAPTTSCGNNINGRFRLEIQTDSYGQETTWNLRERDTGVVVDQTTLAEYSGNQKYYVPAAGSICLQEGICYEFDIHDSFGDGMCCSSGDGYYRGFLDDKQIFQGGQFESLESVSFCVEQSSSPTLTPTPSESMDCEDDADFKYNNKKKKTCNRWVGKGKNNLTRKKFERIKRRCGKTYDGIRIWDYCPTTCGFVDLGKCAIR